MSEAIERARAEELRAIVAALLPHASRDSAEARDAVARAHAVLVAGIPRCILKRAIADQLRATP